jgi:protein-tyrosine phosphatase
MGNHGMGQRDAHRFSPAAPDEQYVYGACSPGWHSAGDHEERLDQWIEFMRSAGIERVCCLLAGRHVDEQFSKYRAEFGDERVRHTPIADGELVSAETLQTDIFPFLEESVEAGEPVVVHSLSGLSRTGQVLAAWLIHWHGYDPTAAVDTVLETGRDPTAVLETGDVTRSDLFALLGEIAEQTPS